GTALDRLRYLFRFLAVAKLHLDQGLIDEHFRRKRPIHQGLGEMLCGFRVAAAPKEKSSVGCLLTIGKWIDLLRNLEIGPGFIKPSQGSQERGELTIGPMVR